MFIWLKKAHKAYKEKRKQKQKLKNQYKDVCLNLAHRLTRVVENHNANLWEHRYTVEQLIREGMVNRVLNDDAGLTVEEVTQRAEALTNYIWTGRQPQSPSAKLYSIQGGKKCQKTKD